MSLILAAAALGGAWLIATPPRDLATSPVTRGAEQHLTLRQLLRIIALFSFATNVSFIPNPAVFPPPFVDLARYCVFAVAWFLYYSYLEQGLARPAQVEKAARMARVLKFAQPPVDCFMVWALLLALSRGWIGREAELWCHAIRELLAITMDVVAIVALYSVINALPRPNVSQPIDSVPSPSP
ncbi:MAG TPA: hypothetical protein VMD30_11345 [Tepidisphaeraceae bacterium]|nr:hypothetical protein [Tepidisphaeraceae bacterium]